MVGALLPMFRLILLPLFWAVDNFCPRFGGHYCRRRKSLWLFRKINNLLRNFGRKTSTTLQTEATGSTETSVTNYQATLLKIRETVIITNNIVKASNRVNLGKTEIVTTQPKSATVQNTNLADTPSRSLDAANNPHMLPCMCRPTLHMSSVLLKTRNAHIV
jgi:hypothetical protein